MQHTLEEQRPFISSVTGLFFGDWTKFLGQLPAPGSSLNQLVVLHQRNWETANEMGALAVESMSKLFHHQLEAADCFAKDSLIAINQIVETGTAKEKLLVQTAWAKDRMEKAMGSVRALSDVLTTANLEARNVFAKRLSDSLAEFGPAA